MAQAGKKTRWAEVTCSIHGKHDPDMPWKVPQVKTSIPNSKRQRMGGCPQCRRTTVSS